MGISVGLVGLGAFGSSFVPLFKAHPLVDRIALCDREPERVRRFAEDGFYRDKFDEDVYDVLGAANVARSYVTDGAAGLRQLRGQIARWRRILRT